jgi:hypothetical protein
MSRQQLPRARSGTTNSHLEVWTAHWMPATVRSQSVVRSRIIGRTPIEQYGINLTLIPRRVELKITNQSGVQRGVSCRLSFRFIAVLCPSHYSIGSISNDEKRYTCMIMFSAWFLKLPVPVLHTTTTTTTTTRMTVPFSHADRPSPILGTDSSLFNMVCSPVQPTTPIGRGLAGRWGVLCVSLSLRPKQRLTISD